MDLLSLQKLIDKYSRFTDSVIEELTIKNIGNEHDDIEFIIKPKFEGYRVRVKCNKVIDSRISALYNYSIWELELKEENGVYIFYPSAVSSEMGDFYIKAKEIEFLEL